MDPMFRYFQNAKIMLSKNTKVANSCIYYAAASFIQCLHTSEDKQTLIWYVQVSLFRRVSTQSVEVRLEVQHSNSKVYNIRNLEKTICFSLKSLPSEQFHRPEMSQIKVEFSLRTNVKLFFHKNVGWQ